MEEEVRKSILDRDMWRCQRCGMGATEIAHRVANTEANKKHIMKRLHISPAEAQSILDHPKNVVASCRECNDYFNIGFKRYIADSIIDAIGELIGVKK